MNDETSVVVKFKVAFKFKVPFLRVMAYGKCSSLFAVTKLLISGVLRYVIWLLLSSNYLLGP